MAAPSFTDLYNLGKAEAQARRPDLAIIEGDVSDMVIAGAAAISDYLIGYFSQRIKATYLDGAKGNDLVTLGDDHWNVQPVAAVKATGTISITRSVPGPAGTIGAATIVATLKDATGKDVQFVTNGSVSWALNETGTKTVGITCIQTGTVGNVAAGEVVRFPNTLFDTFTVTNAAPIAGGAEAESEDAYRSRVRGFPNTLRRATLDALEYGAKQVAGVANSTAQETDTGLVYLFVSDASGSSNPTMVTNVTTEIDANWRAAGALVTVVGATVNNVSISVHVTARAGVDTNTLVANIKAAIVDRVAKLKIAETLTRTMIRSTVVSVAPDDISEVDVITPALDVTSNTGELIRTSSGLVTVS